MAKAKKSDDVDVDGGFNPKYKKLIGDWSDSADSMSTDDLKKTIVDCQKSISDVEKDIEADEHLKALKEEIKDITSGFGDLVKREKAKTMYCVFQLRARGEK